MPSNAPTPTPERLMQFVFGFAPPMIIETALRLDVFDVLEHGAAESEDMFGAPSWQRWLRYHRAKHIADHTDEGGALGIGLQVQALEGAAEPLCQASPDRDPGIHPAIHATRLRYQPSGQIRALFQCLEWR